VSGEQRAHDLLLWFAGWLPDDVVTQCRWWLAAGRDELAVKVAAHTVHTLGLPLSPAQAAALTAAHGEVADEHPRIDDEPEPPGARRQRRHRGGHRPRASRFPGAVGGVADTCSGPAMG